MLFYPGTMLSPFQYRPLLAALREAGFAVAALHLTGHGLNPHNVGFTFDDLLHDGLEAEQWLHDAGLGPLAICGHSQGGILTLAHAAASRRLTAAFPLCGVLPQQDEAISLTLFRPAGRAARKTDGRHQRSDPSRAAPAPAGARLSFPAPDQCRSAPYPGQPAQKPFELSSAFLASLFNARLSPRLRCPLYLFNARDDALFTPTLALSTFDLLHAPYKRLIWLPHGGHLAAMNPLLCRYMARTASAACAGLGLPLRLEATDAP